MSRGMRRFAGATAVSALALIAAACGSSDKSTTSSSASAGSASQESGPGKTGGTLRQLGSTDVDYLDPGHTYYTAGYQVAYVTQRPLYSFKPGETTPTPDLAAGPP